MKHNFNLTVPIAGIFMLALAAVASAQVIDIGPVEESKLMIGGEINIGNSTYRITGMEHVYVYYGNQVSKYRRIFLEDVVTYSNLETMIEAVGSAVSEREAHLDLLDQNLTEKERIKSDLSGRLESLDYEMAILKNESERVGTQLDESESVADEIEARVSGNLLLSSIQTSAVLIIFIILVAVVVAIEIKAYFSPEPAAKKL